MTGNYNSWLVFLSIVVASFASYVALDLASRVVATRGTPSSSYWLFGGALSMGTGIWSMHFIGMLAFQLPIPMSYDIPVTLASLLIAAIVSGFALHTISHGSLSLRRLLGAGSLMGVGIACMHYAGMAAMQLEPPVRYHLPLFIASVAIAIAAAVVALWIAFQLRTETILSAIWKKAGSALIMGCGIAGMHYTGMAAAIFQPDSVCSVSPQDINNVWLAGAIGGITFMLLATTLLVSLFDARTKVLNALRESEERFRGLTELSSDWYWVQDTELRFVATEGVTDARGGITPAAHIGKRRWELPNTAVVNQTWDQHRAVLEARQPFHDLVLRRVDSDGEAHFVSVSGRPVFDAQRKFCGYRGVASDVTARVRAEEQLAKSEARFRALTELSSDLYWETDAEHRLSQYAYGSKIGPVVPVNELIGQRRWEIAEYVSPDEAGWRAHRATLDAHLPFRDFEVASRRAGSDKLRYFSLSGEPMFAADGAFTGYRGVGREITEQKTAEARLDQLAHYDTLTGLPNRALLQDRMRQAMARADRGQTLLAVMFLDLDRFKEINDSLGHAAGDEVLKEAARRLQACLRSTDTVGRLGGDEFTVLLEDVHQVEEISILAGKILAAFAEPAEVGGHELHLSTSIGVTVYPLDDQDANTLLKNADIAMYQAKQEGRNNFQFFAAEMGARTERHADLRLRLHRAMERGEFELHYQPQVGFAGGNIFGVEALLRWTDAGLGQVPPGQFIPVAEEMGLIVRLGDWVLREACRQCKAWLDGGLGPLRVAVNLSPRQFRQKKLAQRIGEVLRETGLPAACLEIEITEGIVMKHAERAIKTLTELNQLGVQIAIDDFGTGYSSLAYLQRFPVHVLKIDQSFVQAIRGPADQVPIVNTVIQLAKLLGLKGLAEGVETAEQREYMRAHGCDAYQGYLFCKPQSAARIGELLAAHRREKVLA
jgi:diguanylate cyclase (GGDEF)-like protein/PAS domain S-box-containing protein